MSLDRRAWRRKSNSRWDDEPLRVLRLSWNKRVHERPAALTWYEHWQLIEYDHGPNAEEEEPKGGGGGGGGGVRT